MWVGGEGEHRQLYWFLLKAELAVRPGLLRCHLTLKSSSLYLTLDFLEQSVHLPQGLAWTATICFEFFLLQLINTLPTTAMLSVPILLTFLYPSEEKSSAEGTNVLDVSTLKSFPESKHSYDNGVICTSWWLYSLPLPLASPDVPICCYKWRLLLPCWH